MENQLLRDSDTFPSDEVIEKALGKSYPAYKEFIATVTSPAYGLNPEWNYYKDGKAWLCKVVYKKKTVCWLSVWDGFFKVSFFFTEKTYPGVAALDIDKMLRDDFVRNKTNIGKLIPLLINVSQSEQLDNIMKIILYKRSLK